MKRAPLLHVDRDRCLTCGACSAVCPQRLLVRTAEGVPEVDAAAEALCIGCGHCAAVCAPGALSHRDAPAPLQAAPDPPPAETVLSWLEGRRSVRTYRSEPVSRELVRLLLQSARAAPSGHNARPVGCVAVLSEGEKKRLTDGLVAFYRRLFRVLERRSVGAIVGLVVGRRAVRELREAAPSMRRAEERLKRGEDPLFHAAPGVLLFHAPRSETAEADCVLAASQVTLFAPSLGLGTCYIGYASAGLKRLPRIGRRAGVPAGDRVFAVLTVGYPAVGFPRLPPRAHLPVRFR